MLDRKSQFWFYPEPTGDVGRDRNARTLQFSCLLFASALAAVALLNTIEGEQIPWPILLSVAGLVASAALNRVGRSAWAGRTSISVLMVGAGLLVFEAHDGFRSQAMLMFPALLLLTVMLLDRTSYIAIAGVVLLAVAALGIAEMDGITRALPGIRSPTSYESIFYVELLLAVVGAIGSRIVGDAQRNVLELRASLDQLSATNLRLKDTVAALRASESQARERATELQAMMDAAPAVILVAHDPECRHITGNRTAYELMRQAPGTNLSLAAPEGERPTNRRVVQDGVEVSLSEMPLHKAALTGQPWRNYEIDVEFADGSSIDLLGNVEPLLDEEGASRGAVAVLSDITERKRAEQEKLRLQQELARAQKMELVGRLAGGIAHDFNNMLSTVVMYADSALDELPEGHSAAEDIGAIRHAAKKAVAIGHQLMTFSGKQMLEIEIFSLNEVIEDDLKLLSRLIGEDIKVVFEPGPGLGLVRADRGQLAQILINLAVNSRDAMPEGGTLTIETATVEFEQSQPQDDREVNPGTWVVLTVRDSGVGMDAETLSRIFEPFFTTKTVGKGTGLGLSVIYGIVNQNDGFVRVASQPGGGTEFKIYLPAVRESVLPLVEKEEGPTPGGAETILLVEDEPTLLHKVHELLAGAGYHVLTAANGDEAMTFVNTGPIHLLLTDVVMPGMSGTRLAERLLTLQPNLRVLYMSGYPNTENAIPSKASFIPKPFTKAKLLRRIRGLLDEMTRSGQSSTVSGESSG